MTTPPVLDGSASGIASTTTTITATLSTSLTNDIICVLAYAEYGGRYNPGQAISSITSTHGLSFTQRTRSHASECGTFELWWAVAASVLTSEVITMTYPSNFDDATLIVFAVNGCNLSAPWDGNGSLPAIQSLNMSSSGSAVPSFTISTTSANDFLIFGLGTGNSWTPPGTIPTGYSLIKTASNGGGSLYAESALAGLAVTTAQSAITVAWGSAIPDRGVTTSGGSSAEFIFDALTADPAASAGTAIGTLNVTVAATMLISRYAVGTASGTATGSGLSLSAEIVSKLVGYAIEGPTQYTVSKLVGYVIDGPNILSVSKFNGYAIQGLDILSVSKLSGYAIVAGSGSREAIGTTAGSSTAPGISNNLSILSVAAAGGLSVGVARGVFLETNSGNSATVFPMV